MDREDAAAAVAGRSRAQLNQPRHADFASVGGGNVDVAARRCRAVAAAKGHASTVTFPRVPRRHLDVAAVVEVVPTVRGACVHFHVTAVATVIDLVARTRAR